MFFLLILLVFSIGDQTTIASTRDLSHQFHLPWNQRQEAGSNSNAPHPPGSFPQPNYSPPLITKNQNLDLIPNSAASSGYGWPPPPPQGNSHHPAAEHHVHHHASSPTSGWGANNNQSHDFRSYFDIALTALAFLSFGIFLLNLLLNALLYAGLLTTTGTGTGGMTGTGGTGTGGTSTGTGTSTGGMTTTGGGTATGGGMTSTGGITTTGTGGGITTTGARARGPYSIRTKRETLQLFLDPATSMDALALNVLKAIDAMMQKDKECLQKTFCDGNRQAKIISSNFQYLVPIYSLSTSWIGKKFCFHDDLISHTEAILNGLLESNCQQLYPHC